MGHRIKNNRSAARTLTYDSGKDSEFMQEKVATSHGRIPKHSPTHSTPTANHACLGLLARISSTLTQDLHRINQGFNQIIFTRARATLKRLSKDAIIRPPGQSRHAPLGVRCGREDTISDDWDDLRQHRNATANAGSVPLGIDRMSWRALMKETHERWQRSTVASLAEQRVAGCLEGLVRYLSYWHAWRG